VSRTVKVLAVLVLAVAVSATAQTFGLSLGANSRACLSIGDASYRVSRNLPAGGLTVRLDPAAAAADVRIQLAETADDADFVFVDDGDAPPVCHRGARTKNVTLDAATASPDLVVALAGDGAAADYRIYVRSRWLTPEAVAAMFAASHAPARRLASRLADHSN
jgi:fructose-specific component phosphotransferase system IIB-like protein